MINISDDDRTASARAAILALALARALAAHLTAPVARLPAGLFHGAPVMALWVGAAGLVLVALVGILMSIEDN